MSKDKIRVFVYLTIEKQYKEYDCMDYANAKAIYNTFKALGDRAMIVVSSEEMSNTISDLLLNDNLKKGCAH
jgi:hypothetical protein